MKKRILSLILALIMCLCISPACASALGEEFFVGGNLLQPPAPAVPYIELHDQENAGVSTTATLWHSMPKELLALGACFVKDAGRIRSEYNLLEPRVFIQCDVSVDSADKWAYNPSWDTGYADNTDLRQAPMSENLGGTRQEKLMSSNLFDLYWAECREALGDAVVSHGSIHHLDLDNHTLYFRIRYVIEYTYADGSTAARVLPGAWSQVCSIGKNGTQQPLSAPVSLPAPTLSTPSMLILDRSDSAAMIGYYVDIPLGVYEVDRYLTVNDRVFAGKLETQVNVDETGWKDVLGDGSNWDSYGFLSDNISGPVNDKSYVQIRARYVSDAYTSDWSKAVSVNAPVWQNASDWAKDYLRKADSFELIPDRLNNTDMTEPINRAEFAAVAVKFYEALSGRTVSVASVNPFTDTSDEDVLKAYGAGIVNGVTDTTFAPSELVTREQAATMLTRVFVNVTGKEIFTSTPPTGGVKTAYLDAAATAADKAGGIVYSVPTIFSDDKCISDWAYHSVYFMAVNDIIVGIGSNIFAPNPETAPAGSEAYYGQATREEAMKIAVVGFQNLLG